MNIALAAPNPSATCIVSYLPQPEAGRSTIGDLLALMGAGEGAPPVRSMPVALRRVREGETLFRQGARVDAVHVVRSGTFKIFHTAEDGYQQVLGFVGSAEALGVDAMSSQHHPTEAIALEDSSVFALPTRDLPMLAQQCPALARAMNLAMSDALARQCEAVDAIAAVAAEVRLSRFLLRLSERMAARGQSPSRFVLRMSRRDIASYLGVAHETVSRSFTTLAGWNLLDVHNREVAITDMAGLRALSLATRRQIDEASRRRVTSPVARAA